MRSAPAGSNCALESFDAARSIQSQQIMATVKAQAAFDALLARVFSG